ncbi:hypothetical protein K435DRAFT_310547 [Dendrothele bispora CBS 962.96]|uniref:Rad60/SUMO-like domain-containing protein n=1 Tax=Dendrothele bispora (strain CBS 962.96) TaxID=1314807 RepID=A0A4V4HHK4_DENBC|nr:hypothetical protein K435DRAFT_310547 [Dendrothele bispora CBS 962.96]
MFIRNKTRDKDTWAKLHKLDKEKEARSRAVVAESTDDDSETEQTPRRKSKGKEKKSNLPVWERNEKFKRYLSQDKSSDEDSDGSLDIKDVDKTPHANLKRKRGDSKKPRSRSRSITPPPQVPLHQLQNARNIVRKALGVSHTTSTPELDDDFRLDETQNRLDPELAAYARKHASKQHAYPRGSSSGPEDKVTVRVRWQPHPKELTGKQTITEFRLDKNDDFSALFDAVAEEAEILPDSVVMTLRGNRFFPSVTPEALNIWDQAEFVACDKTTYDYLRKESRFASQQPPSNKPTSSSNTWKQAHVESDDDDDEIVVLGSDGEPSNAGDESSDVELISENEALNTSTAAPASSLTPDQDDGPTFKLVLRSGKTQNDITLTVRPTTKCGAIVKAFLKKAGFADKDEYAGFLQDAASSGAAPKPKKKPRKNARGAATVASDQKIPTLCVDGDKVGNDTEIGDQDLEDGDMIEVVGL